MSFSQYYAPGYSGQDLHIIRNNVAIALPV